MRLHRLADAVDVRLPEPEPEAAADDHGLDVEHVHARPHAGAERAHRALDQALGELVAALERARPDTAGQPRAATVFHDLEQHRLLAALDLLARAQLHRQAACVCLQAADAPARALRAAHLHHHVADLAGGVAADPRLAVEHDAAADARPPEHAEHRLVRAAGPELELGVGGDLHVVAERDGCAARLLQRPAQVEAAAPSRQVLGAGHGAGRVVDLAGGADADADQRRGLYARALGRLLQSGGDLRRNAGRTSLGRGRAARLPGHLVVVVDDDRLDLRPAEIDAAAVAHHPKILPPEYLCHTGHPTSRPRVRWADAYSHSVRYADVLGEDDPTRSGPGPQAMISSIVPRIYERVWRPLFAPVLMAGRLDELAMALEMLELRPGDSVLDVGCGPGNFTRAFARASLDGLAVGLDASRTMLDQA